MIRRIEIPEKTTKRSEPTGLAKLGIPCVLMGTDTGLAHQQAAGQVVVGFWNQTEQFIRSKSRPLAGYPGPLETLPLADQVGQHKPFGSVPDPSKIPTRIFFAGLLFGPDRNAWVFGLVHWTADPHFLKLSK